MGILLDTSVLVAAERRKFDLPAFLRAHQAQEVAIGAIAASELLHGCERAKTASQKREREQFVEAILARVPIVPFDLPQARVHARLWAEQAKRGKAVGAHDLMTGATAISVQFALATLNVEDFKKIPGLSLAETAKYETR